MSAEYNSPAKAGSAWTWIKETAPAITNGKTWTEGGGAAIERKGPHRCKDPGFVSFTSPRKGGKSNFLWFLYVFWLLSSFVSGSCAIFPATTLRYCNNNKVTPLWKANTAPRSPVLWCLCLWLPLLLLLFGLFLMNLLILLCGDSYRWDSWKGRWDLWVATESCPCQPGDTSYLILRPCWRF